jgi:hypothetical protein
LLKNGLFDQNALDPLLREARKRCVDLASGAGVDDCNVPRHCGVRRVHGVDDRLRIRTVRIDKLGKARGLRQPLVQYPKPLEHELGPNNKAEAGDVAARPVEAGDETRLDRVPGHAEDHRDRRGCGFGSKCRCCAAHCRDNGHSASDKICHQLRQPIESVFGKSVFDCHVAAFGKAGLAQSLAECRRANSGRVLRAAVEISNKRHCQLLCPRRERPSERRSPETNEIPPSHCAPQ